MTLTHGHSDYVGALEELVQKYPDVQVVFHQDEATYITGQPAHLVLESQRCISLIRRASPLVYRPRGEPYRHRYVSERQATRRPKARLILCVQGNFHTMMFCQITTSTM